MSSFVKALLYNYLNFFLTSAKLTSTYGEVNSFFFSSYISLPQALVENLFQA